MSTRDELKKEQRAFTFWIGVAAAGHVALIAAFVLFQLFYVFTHPPLKIVSVSLVSMPGAPGPAGGPKSAPEPAPVVAKEPSEPKAAPVKKVPEPNIPQPKKIPEPVVSRKVPEPVPVPKKPAPVDVEKQSQQNLKSALEKLEKTTASQKPASNVSSTNAGNMSSALANLQKKLAKEGGGGPASSGSGTGGGGGPKGSGGGASDPYRAKIAGIIQDNWLFSDKMVRSKAGLEVYVNIHILPDGSLGDVLFVKKSSSEYLNDSAKNAIKKSAPFPLVPKESGPGGVWIGFQFTPEGLSR
ncbi:MAG TPA: TonB C-terminal domain-containing protein [Chlorobaculum sp.]|nr:TonB C-terminal domain-containing protein [Chlorobaculum sp.]